MTEPINASAKLLNNDDELVFRLEDDTLQIVQPFKHSERLLESYTLSAAGYPEALKDSPAALLILMNKQEPELLEANPMPAIVIDSASIQYHANSANSTTFTLNQWTNGTEEGTSLSSNRYSPLSIAGDRRPYEEWPDSPLLAAPTDAQTFADLSKKLYEDGVQGVLPAELLSGDNRWPGLDSCSGSSQLLIKDPTWIHQPDTDSYYQAAIRPAGNEQPLVVTLDRRYLNTNSQLVQDSQPILECTTEEKAEQFKRWFTNDLTTNPAMTVGILEQLHDFSYPPPDANQYRMTDNYDDYTNKALYTDTKASARDDRYRALSLESNRHDEPAPLETDNHYQKNFVGHKDPIDPKHYAEQHERIDKAKMALSRQHEGIAAHATDGPQDPTESYQIVIFTEEIGGEPVSSVLITARNWENQAQTLNVLPLTEPIDLDAAEARAAHFENTLHGPHGANGVLKQADLQLSTLPVPHSQFEEHPLPFNKPEEPGWQRVDVDHYLNVEEQPNSNKLVFTLLSRLREEDGSPIIHQQTLDGLSGLGDLPDAMRQNDSEAWRQANSLYQTRNGTPSILNEMLAGYPIDNSQPIMRAIDDNGFHYGIESDGQTTELIKYSGARPLLRLTLDEHPDPEQTGLYEKALWGPDGASGVIDLIDPDQKLDRTRWPAEAFESHQPVGENWVIGEDGRWSQAVSYRLQNGQPGHRVDFQETELGPEGVPVAVSKAIGHFLDGNEARRLVDHLNEELIEDPGAALQEVEERSAAERFQNPSNDMEL